MPRTKPVPQQTQTPAAPHDLWHAATSVRYKPLCGTPQPGQNTTHNASHVTCPECVEKAKVLKEYEGKGKR